MSKILIIKMVILVILITLPTMAIYSQTTLKPKSYAELNKQKITNIDAITSTTTPIPNVDSLLNFERELNSDGKVRPELYGFAYEVQINIVVQGTWDTLVNGDRIWRLKND